MSQRAEALQEKESKKPPVFVMDPFQGQAGGLNDGLFSKRVVFTMGGKGGVGKTTVMSALTEWYKANGLTVDIVDMDPENRAVGSLASLFASAKKWPATEQWAYDQLLALSMTSEADIIPVDIGAAQAHQMIPWIQKFYRAAQETGIPLRWTAIGVIDGKDVASAQSVLQWGEALQDTVDYLVVHNNSTRGSETAWHDPMLRGSVDRFVKALNPTEIYLEKRRPRTSKCSYAPAAQLSGT